MLKASTLGSSWNRADRSGVAPMRSPADTKTVFGLVALRAATWVARYSVPPAGMQVAGRHSRVVGSGFVSVREPIRPTELAVATSGSSWPW